MADARIVFSPQAVLALPYMVTECQGARVQGSRDADAHPQVLCIFDPGALVQPAPTFGIDTGSALVLSPSDARALARALELAAEEAEEQ
jgi:hypothetical protein